MCIRDRTETDRFFERDDEDMAMLVMINSKKSTVWNGIHYDNSNFNNVNAVENLIHYVTRTRENEDRAGDLITCGAAGAGYYQTVEDTIHIASQSSPPV